MLAHLATDVAQNFVPSVLELDAKLGVRKVFDDHAVKLNAFFLVWILGLLFDRTSISSAASTCHRLNLYHTAQSELALGRGQPLLDSQNFRSFFCDGHCVLKVGGELAVSRHHRPTIVQGHHIHGAFVDHRLDADRGAFSKDRAT